MGIKCSAKLYLGAGIVMAVLCAVLIPVSIFVPVYITNTFSEKIYYNVLITEKASNDPDHQVYQAWKDSTSKAGNPTTLHAYMWNVTNAHEVVFKNQKPNLVQTGPYLYTIIKKKDHIEFDEDLYGEKIVRYVEFKTYIFDRKNTAPALATTDTYTNINLVFQLWRALISGPMTSLIFKETDLLNRFGPNQKYDDTVFTDFERQYITKSVDEWLFGWRDARFDAEASYQGFFPGLLGPNRTDASDSSPGHAMYTGETRIGNSFTYYQHDGPYTYNRNSRNPINPNEPLWNGDYFASRFAGTDGTRFPPHVNSSAPLFVYVDEAKRGLAMEYTHSYQLNGLELYNYEIANTVLQNSTMNPTNALWDMHSTAIFNLTNQKMMPMIISKPHFLHCDDSLRNKVVGLAEDPDLHETRLGIHAISGVVMKASKSLQVAINTIGPLTVKSISETWFENMNTNTFVPIAWFSEKGQIRNQDATDLAAQISKVDFIVQFLTLGSSILCVLLLLASGGLLVMAYHSKIKNIQVFNNGGAYGDYSTINI